MMEIDKALRVALLGCHRAQLIEALGYDFVNEARAYWRQKRVDAMVWAENQLQAEFPDLRGRIATSPSPGGLVGLQSVRITDESVITQRVRALRLQADDFIDNSGSVIQRSWLHLRLVLHLLFDKDDDGGYTWPAKSILRLKLAWNMKRATLDFSLRYPDTHAVYVELEECWARGMMGLDAIPAILERLEKEAVNVEE